MNLVKTRVGKMRIFISVILLIVAGNLFFMTMCKRRDYGSFLIIAHRGASRAAPENTLAAIRKAIEFRADYAELDVLQTKDGEIVLMHDEDLERTTGKAGKIWEYTLADLKKLEAGAWFGLEFSGEPIPTLKEVVKTAKGRIKLNIEIKITGHEPDLVRKVVDIVQQESLEEECMITSFDRDAVESVKELTSEIPTGFIFDEEFQGDAFEGNWDAVCCDRVLVNRRLVQKAKKRGKKIYVWTVNNPKEMEKYLDLGVDGIITDVPDVLRGIVDQKTRSGSRNSE